MGNRIVGMEGAIYFRVSIHGKVYWATCAGDLVVHPDCRRQGLSKMIVSQYMIDHRLDISWQNKISERSLFALANYRGHRLSNWVKIVNHRNVLRQMLGKNNLPKWYDIIIQGIKPLTRPLIWKPFSSSIRTVWMTAFDKCVYDLWQKVQNDYSVLTVRDLQYLKWRYLDRPDASYITVSAKKGDDFVGYLIFRMGEKRGMRVGYLVDFLVEGKSPKILSSLIGKAVSYLIKEGVDYISCQAMTSFGRRVLYSHGFYSWRWGVTSYFTPRTQIPGQMLKIPQYAKAFEDIRQWYLTMGDGDLELSL